MSSNIIMDFIGNLTAASRAEKLPSTKQINTLTNWLLKSPLLQLDASAAGCGGNLSENGSALLTDIRELIQAYQAAATEKNGDDILQEAIFTLSRAGRQQSDYRGDNIRQGETQMEGQDLIGALRIAVQAFMGGVNWSGDLEHGVERSARRPMETLREQGPASDSGDGSFSRFDEAALRVAERAQSDPEYRHAINTIFSIYDKYKNRSTDSSQYIRQPQNVANVSELEADLADILGGGEVPGALKNIRSLVERFAGGRSLQGVLAAAATCGADLREDQEIRRVVDDMQNFVRKSMDESGYIESNQCRTRQRELQQQWKQLQNRNTEAGRRFKSNVERLQMEVREFGNAVEKDNCIQRLKNAHLKLSKRLDTVAPALEQFVTGQPSFVLSDLSDVLLPRLFSLLQNIPLPRTEYSDAETEFVLENLNIESLQLPPGRAKITNQGSLGLGASGLAAGQSKTDLSNKSRIQFSGVQLALKQVSFYYHDKTSGIAPSTVNGLLDVTIPQKGLDVDVQISVLPPMMGPQQREKRDAFLRVDRVSVSLDNVNVAMSKTNRPVATTLFKPVLRTRLLNAIQASLENYLRFAIETGDSIAYDVHQHAQVFYETTRASELLGTHALGLTSALGRMIREGRFFEGLRDSQTGTTLSMGSAQQTFRREKQGPMATGQRPGAEMQGMMPKVKGEGVPQEAENFVDVVARKREAEARSEGWRTRAYDLPPGIAA